MARDHGIAETMTESKVLVANLASPYLGKTFDHCGSAANWKVADFELCSVTKLGTSASEANKSIRTIG